MALDTCLGVSGTNLPWSEALEVAGQASLLISATPLGKGRSGEPAWGSARLSSDAYVYGFVYAEHIAGSIRAAQGQGLGYTDDWERLPLQAAAMIPLLGLPEKLTPGEVAPAPPWRGLKQCLGGPVDALRTFKFKQLQLGR